jgi:hypothetical protein
MTDTPIEIERMVRERIMARSAEDRFIMGAQMFEAALAMIRASLPPDLSEAERRRRLFQRIYGAPIPAASPEKRDAGADASVWERETDGGAGL